jgi:hypothetical protein
MKSSHAVIAALVVTNALTVAYFVRKLPPPVEIIRAASADLEELRRENAALNEKLAASEQAMAELKKTAIFVHKPDPAKLDEYRRRANSPAQLDARAAELRQIIERQYAPLIKKLGLSEPATETLKQLLVELRQVSKEAFRQRDAAGLPAPTGPESIRIGKEAQQPVYDSIRTLLGDEKYEAFQHYSGTLAERQLLEQMTQGIRHSDTPLSEPQFDALIDTLSGANREVRSANGGYMPLHEPVENLKQRYAAVLEKSRAFLSPEQLAKVQRAFDDDIAVKEKRAAAAAERTK